MISKVVARALRELLRFQSNKLFCPSPELLWAWLGNCGSFVDYPFGKRGKGENRYCANIRSVFCETVLFYWLGIYSCAGINIRLDFAVRVTSRTFSEVMSNSVREGDMWLVYVPVTNLQQLWKIWMFVWLSLFQTRLFDETLIKFSANLRAAQKMGTYVNKVVNSRQTRAMKKSSLVFAWYDVTQIPSDLHKITMLFCCRIPPFLSSSSCNVSGAGVRTGGRSAKFGFFGGAHNSSWEGQSTVPYVTKVTTSLQNRKGMKIKIQKPNRMDFLCKSLAVCQAANIFFSKAYINTKP